VANEVKRRYWTPLRTAVVVFVFACLVAAGWRLWFSWASWSGDRDDVRRRSRPQQWCGTKLGIRV